MLVGIPVPISQYDTRIRRCDTPSTKVPVLYKHRPIHTALLNKHDKLMIQLQSQSRGKH
jgi:hypothetical protein